MCQLAKSTLGQILTRKGTIQFIENDVGGARSYILRMEVLVNPSASKATQLWADGSLTYRNCAIKVGVIDEIIADAAEELPVLHRYY